MRRSTIALISIASALSFGLLSGCGGSDSSSTGGGGGGLVNNAKFTIAWPARSRDLQAPSSALSFRFVMNGAGQTGADVTFNGERPAGTAAVNTTYTLAQGVKADSRSFTIRFFGAAGQAGSVVGEATANANLSGGNILIDTVQLEGTVENVVVPNASIVVGEAATQLTFTAKDADGNTLATSPGSAMWRLADGASFATLTADGKATGVAAGTAHVIAKVDGVDSNAASLAVQAASQDEISAARIGLSLSSTQAYHIVGNKVLVNSSTGGRLLDLTDNSSVDFPPTSLSPSGTKFGGKDDDDHPLWYPNGVTGTTVDLWPGDGVYDYAKVFAVSETQQVGLVGDLNAHFEHAAVWSGSASTLQELHPAGALNSSASAIFGSTITGIAYFTGQGGYSQPYILSPNGQKLTPAGHLGGGTTSVGMTWIGGCVWPSAGKRNPGVWSLGGSFRNLDTVTNAGTVWATGRESGSASYAVGYSADASGVSRAYLWNAATGKGINLDTYSPLGAGHGSEAKDLSAIPGGGGIRVVGFCTGVPSGFAAVAWTVPDEVLATLN